MHFEILWTYSICSKLYDIECTNRSFFLKGEQKNKAEALTPQEQRRIMEACDLETPKGLQMALWFRLAIFWCLRGFGPHKQMKWGDCEPMKDSDGREYLR